MKVSIKRKTRNLEALIKKIQKLSTVNIESGYFQEQGQHPYAELSYVELAWMHARGEGNLPARDVRLPTMFGMENPSFYNPIHKDLREYFYKNKKINSVLTDIGVRVTDLAKSFFGVPSQFLPANSSEWAEIKGANTPLVFEGHLMDAWSFKTSELPSIRGT